MDHEAGTVTFSGGTEPLALFADYELEYVKDANGSYGDIEVNKFNPQVPTELMGPLMMQFALFILHYQQPYRLFHKMISV